MKVKELRNRLNDLMDQDEKVADMEIVCMHYPSDNRDDDLEITISEPVVKYGDETSWVEV